MTLQAPPWRSAPAPPLFTRPPSKSTGEITLGPAWEQVAKGIEGRYTGIRGTGEDARVVVELRLTPEGEAEARELLAGGGEGR